jgi:hypothetical protein
MPERQVSSFSSYYLVPACWIDDNPTKEEINKCSYSDLLQEVYRTTLTCGLRVRVTKGGFFTFDFSQWPPAQGVTIPEYIIKTGGKDTTPQAVKDAEVLGQQHIVKQVEIMNVHIACLYSAIGICEKKSSITVLSLSPSDYMPVADFENPNLGITFKTASEPVHALIFANGGSFNAPRPPFRISIKKDSIVHSFKLLDEIVNLSMSDATKIVEFLWKASLYYARHEFAWTLVISWTVCERLLSYLWDQLPSSAQFVEYKAKKKKSPKQPSAYDMTVDLDTAGKLTAKLKSDLDTVRVKRNDWIHNFQLPLMSDAARAQALGLALFKHITNISLPFPLSIALLQTFSK